MAVNSPVWLPIAVHFAAPFASASSEMLYAAIPCRALDPERLTVLQGAEIEDALTAILARTFLDRPPPR